MVSIKGLNKADVLAVLYNASKPQGMGFMQYDAKPMTREEARKILDSGQTYFDYLKGRVMKVDLSKDDEFNPWGFDRDNGQGAAERAVNSLRGGSGVGKTNPKAVQEAHRAGTLQAAAVAKEVMGQKTTVENSDGLRIMCLGLDDVANVLHSKIGKAERKSRQ